MSSGTSRPRFLTLAAMALAATALIAESHAGAQVGQPAPAFSETDTSGMTWALDGLAGKGVILEWTNHDCPYVRKHYSGGNMQAMQRDAAEQGYVWLSVISSAPGKQGYVTPEEADQLSASRDAAPSAVLLDADGDMGRAYGAQTTPHMYVIDPAGTLAYMGGIDDRPTSNPADVDGAINYVRLAIADLAAGKAIAQPVTRPYGCSVKY